MEKKLTEIEVLEKLGVADFGSVVGDKVLSLENMMEEMDPEVVKKVIELFPELTNTAKESLSNVEKVADKILEKNSESTNSVYSSYDDIIHSAQKEIDREDVPFEEKKYYFDKMEKAAEGKSQKDTENKDFLGKVVKYVSGAAVFAVGIVASALVGKPLLGSIKSN